MKIVFMGTPDFAVPCLKALVENGHEIPVYYIPPHTFLPEAVSFYIPCL